MKKLIMIAVAAATIATATTAPAQQPVAEGSAPVVVAPMSDAPSVTIRSYAQPRAQVRSNQRPGVLSNLIELERRKNAWLRRTFLGR